jgi:hypothetical protein
VELETMEAGRFADMEIMYIGGKKGNKRNIDKQM